MKYLLQYSYREYAEIEIDLPKDADPDDEDVVWEALEKQHNLVFSEDEEFQPGWIEPVE